MCRERLLTAIHEGSEGFGFGKGCCSRACCAVRRCAAAPLLAHLAGTGASHTCTPPRPTLQHEGQALQLVSGSPIQVPKTLLLSSFMLMYVLRSALLVICLPHRPRCGSGRLCCSNAGRPLVLVFACFRSFEPPVVITLFRMTWGLKESKLSGHSCGTPARHRHFAIDGKCGRHRPGNRCTDHDQI